jgi:hypothetical protein
VITPSKGSTCRAPRLLGQVDDLIVVGDDLLGRPGRRDDHRLRAARAPFRRPEIATAPADVLPSYAPLVTAPDTETGWTLDGPNIATPEQLELIRSALETTWLIVEHRFFHGSRAPESFVVDDFAKFDEYLRTRARPGDSLWCWRYDDLCRDDNSLTHGKYPDSEGKVPRGGAY